MVSLADFHGPAAGAGLQLMSAGTSVAPLQSSFGERAIWPPLQYEETPHVQFVHVYPFEMPA
jgi:hypothetical protein